ARLAREPVPEQPRVEVAQRRSLRIRRWFESPALPPAGLAAGLLLFAFVWWALQGNRESGVAQKSPGKRAPAHYALVADLVKQDVRLAKAKSPRDKVEALTDAAVNLHDETKMLAFAADGDDLKRLAQMYSKVVRGGVVEWAKSLSAKEREQVLNP